MNKKEVYIISAVRTPMGSFGGGLKDFPAPKLGGITTEPGAGCVDGLRDSG